MTTASWWLLPAAIAAVIFAAGGYRRSLSRRPTRNCHVCKGRGWHRGWLWWYAKGPCTGRTVLAPRGACDRGQVQRYGRRVLHIGDK